MTQKRTYTWYCVCAAIGLLLLSAYPLYMGISVVSDMIRYGVVQAEEYPKYVIPYAPISLALLVGVCLMPLWRRLSRKWAFWIALVLSVGVFLTAELLLEQLVMVKSTITMPPEAGDYIPVEGWQLHLCAVLPDSFATRPWTQTEVGILAGEYGASFKFHFYIISLVLISAVLYVIYGFARVAAKEEAAQTARYKRALVLQSVSAGLFLGLCILACFTAFFRKGELTVSPLSACLMCLFFWVFGMTVGLFVGSLLLERSAAWRISGAGVSASIAAMAMYIGELCLLHGHLYRFGTGWFFEACGPLVLAPVDMLVVLASGAACAGLMALLSKRSARPSEHVSSVKLTADTDIPPTTDQQG